MQHATASIAALLSPIMPCCLRSCLCMTCTHPAAPGPCPQLNAISFEKDDDTNYHMQVRPQPILLQQRCCVLLPARTLLPARIAAPVLCIALNAMQLNGSVGAAGPPHNPFPHLPSHLQFIAGFANMRARNYAIPEVDKLQVNMLWMSYEYDFCRQQTSACGILHVALLLEAAQQACMWSGITSWQSRQPPCPRRRRRPHPVARPS